MFEEYFSEDLYNDFQIRYIFKLINLLNTFEIGYLRFDNDTDLVRIDPVYHPQFHLDVNYTSNATYKIGLNNNLEAKLFEQLIDNSTECLFLNI